MKQLVYVMLSGGVDSSVATLLLQQSGLYNLKCVFMKCWSLEKLQEKGFDKSIYACNWEEDLIDAQMIAKKLGLPFEVWNFEDQYADQVIDYMIEEYNKGRTPNPDVMCNSVVKFGVFYNRAMLEGADNVATGHYARIVEVDNCRYIGQAKDYIKDQSYFLWKIPIERIQKTLFPIGEIVNKNQVRLIAKQNNLLTADKKDSQGLCFVGKSSLQEMLKQKIGVRVGEIITRDLEKASGAIKITKAQKEEFVNKGYLTIGYHQGYYLYTIGQRDNLGLSGGPWLVKSLKIEENKVEVIHGSNIKDNQTDNFVIDNLNIFAILEEEKIYTCITRYNQQLMLCKITLLEGSIRIVLINQKSTIASGQSCVIYDEDILIAGGVIV